MDKQTQIDQYLCEQAFQALVRRAPMQPGAVVTDFEIFTGPGVDGIEHIDSAVVEQRHIDAAELCRANYPLGHVPGSVVFLVAPPAASV